MSKKSFLIIPKFLDGLWLIVTSKFRFRYVKKSAAKVKRYFIEVTNLNDFSFDNEETIKLNQYPPIRHSAACQHPFDDEPPMFLLI